jgi:4-aminobutyrate aminotransferase-like enzyme
VAITSEKVAGAIPERVLAADLVYRTHPGIQFVAAAGVTLRDTHGREYLDAEAANGTLGLGYDESIIQEAAARAAHLPALPSFCESQLRLEVIGRIADRLDSATGMVGRVAVDLGGAQGIEMALRIAAANRGGGPIIVYQGGYHGRSALTAHLSASSRYRATQPWAGPEIVRLAYPDCASCPASPGDGSCNPVCAAAIERLGREETGVPQASSSRGVAALVIEPFLNVGGSVLPNSELLQRTVEHVRSLGGLIIIDEVFTGLHRLGSEWGFQLQKIRPDIVVASKALTNGATAFSCVWAREPLAHPDVVPPGSHSSTYAGNPFALAVVDTVLDRWDALPAESMVSALAQTLDTSLRSLSSRDVVLDTNTVGGVGRVRLRGPYASRARALATDPAADYGLLLASTGMAPDILTLHPPLTTSTENIQLMTALLDNALGRLEDIL